MNNNMITRENNQNLLSATQVTQRLNISAHTLDTWYKYYGDETLEKPENMPELPVYIQQRPRGPRFWKEFDIATLLAFKQWVPKGRGGVMGRVNERYWSVNYRKPVADKEEV